MNINIDVIKKYLWEPYNKYLNSIEVWGSSVLDFLDTTRDIDIVLFCKDEISYDAAKKELKHLRAIYKEFYDWCIHFNIDTNDFMSKKSTNVKLWSSFKKVLFGKKNAHDYDILNNKDEYYIQTKNSITSLINSTQIYVLLKSKLWYYNYINMCILKNNSYEFTKEQQENIKKLHDIELKKDFQDIKLIKECLEYFEIDSSEIENYYIEVHKNEEK